MLIFVTHFCELLEVLFLFQKVFLIVFYCNQKYRNLQNRLSTIKTIETDTQKKVVFLSELVSYLNTSEFLTSNLNVSDTTIAIDGQTYSIFTLNTLIDKLKKNPSVISISIEELTSLDQGIRFKLITTLQQTDISL